MAGSSEVTGMKCMDWFSPGRLPRNWHRQQVMDYRACPYREFSLRFRAPKTHPVFLSLMLRTSLRHASYQCVLFPSLFLFLFLHTFVKVSLVCVVIVRYGQANIRRERFRSLSLRKNTTCGKQILVVFVILFIFRSNRQYKL